MAFQAGAIVSQLTLDRSKFSASVRAVRKQTKNLGSWVKKNSGQFKAMGLAATAAGAAVLLTFKKMVRQYVETGDMIHKMALRTGFAAETLSELAYAADISGADITMLEKGVKKMSKTIVDASYGLETYLRVFRSLGLEVNDLLKMSPEEQFMKIGAAIADMEDDTLRTAAAVDVFGRSGTMLLPLFKEGAEGIEKLRKEAHTLGIIFDEEAAAKAAKLKDAQTALKGSVQGLSIAILNDLIPVITDVVKGFTDWFVKSRKDAGDWTQAILSFFKVIAQGIEGLMLAWGTFKVFVFTMGEEIVRHMAKLTLGIVLITGYTKKMGILTKTHEAAKTALKDLITVGMGYSETTDDQIEKVSDIVFAFDNFIAVLDKLSEGLKAGKEDVKDVGETITESVLPPARELADVFEKLEGVALPAARKLNDVLKLVVPEFKKGAKDIEKSWKEAFRKIIYVAYTFTDTLGMLFDTLSAKLIMNLESEYEKRKELIESSLISEENKAKALENLDKEFAHKRKKAARTAAKRTKAVGIMEAIIHTASAVIEALPDIPLAIAVGILGAIQTAIIAAQPLPALAAGGGIGAAGIVGEAGPELFFPKTPGTIVPLRNEATPFPAQTAITMTFLGPLIATTGVARADLEKAGNALFDIIEAQARRRGYTLNGA